MARSYDSYEQGARVQWWSGERPWLDFAHPTRSWVPLSLSRPSPVENAGGFSFSRRTGPREGVRPWIPGLVLVALGNFDVCAAAGPPPGSRYGGFWVCVGMLGDCCDLCFGPWAPGRQGCPRESGKQTAAAGGLRWCRGIAGRPAHLGCAQAPFPHRGVSPGPRGEEVA